MGGLINKPFSHVNCVVYELGPGQEIMYSGHFDEDFFCVEWVACLTRLLFKQILLFTQNTIKNFYMTVHLIFYFWTPFFGCGWYCLKKYLFLQQNWDFLYFGFWFILAHQGGLINWSDWF